MSDDKLEKIRLKKAELIFKLQSMPNEIINLANEDEFNKLLKEFHDNIVVIDFWAIWCAPCKVFAPIFEKVYKEYSKDFIFAKINVDENPIIAQYYGIRSIPTIIILKENQILRKFTGVVNINILKQILDKLKS